MELKNQSARISLIHPMPSGLFKILIWALPILGLATKIITHLFIHTIFQNPIAGYIVGLFHSVNLGFFIEDHIQLTDDLYLSTGELISFLFDILLLVSAILFTLSKGKEIRLATFLFSIIFISQSLSLLISLISISINFTHISSNMLVFIGNMIYLLATKGLYIWLSLAATATLLNPVQLKTITTTYDTFSETEAVAASKWVRFFHRLMDLLILLLCFSPYMTFLIKNMSLPDDLGRLFMTLIYGIAVLIFFTLSEFFMGGSPAKMLSQTTVINEHLNKPSLGTLIARSLCRLIPFEPLSFFGYQGWHDKFSGTQVVLLENNGVPGKRYWWIPISLLLTSFLSYSAFHAYQENKNLRMYKEDNEQKAQWKINELSQLDTNTVLKLIDVNNPYSGEVLYFKITKLTPKLVSGLTLTENSNEIRTSYDLINHLKSVNLNGRQELSIPVEELKSSVCTDPENDTCGFTFPGSRNSYKIETVHHLNGTDFKAKDYPTRNDKQLEISILNEGWPGTITGLKKLEGTFDLDQNSLPMEVYTYSPYQFNSSLILSNLNEGELFKIELEVKDSLGKAEKYLVTGTDRQYNFSRVR